MSAAITTVVRDASHLGGGMMNVAQSLHAHLRSSGVTAHFVSGNSTTDAAAESHVVGFNGRKLRHLPASVLTSVVHIHGLWTPFEYRAFHEARRRRAAVVMSPHGTLEPWAFDHKWAKKRFAWWLYQRRILQASDLLVVNSDQESGRLRELGLTPPIAVIPNGVDLDGFSPELAGKEREKTILFFSRIDPKKGIPDLLAAWRSLSDHKGHRLHICGHGEAAYVAGIQKQIASLGLTNVALLPAVFGADRWDVFARASIYVLPSYSENFGITVAEALSAGVPVITTRATPWSGLAGEGVGWIVGNDVTELASALRAAMNVEPAALSQMRRKAMAYAGQRFGWDAIARQYIETYNWIAAPEKAAPSWVSSD